MWPDALLMAIGGSKILAVGVLEWLRTGGLVLFSTHTAGRGHQDPHVLQNPPSHESLHWTARRCRSDHAGLVDRHLWETRSHAELVL